jgi:uncharacterized protein (TIRG00374 family)
MNEQKGKLGKNILMVVRFAVVFAGIGWAVYWLSQEGRIGKVVELFKQLNPAIIAVALAAYIAGQLSVAVRWWILLRTQKIYISIWAAIKLFFLGLFYNNFMPSSVGGDVLRAWYVTKHTERKFEAVLSIFVDRLIGFIGSIVIAIVFYFFIPTKEPMDFGMQGESLNFFSRYSNVLMGIAVIIVVSVLILLAVSKTRNYLNKLLQTGVEQIKVLFVKLFDAAVLYCKKPVQLLAVFVMTIALQIFTITGFWLAGRQIGVDVSLSYYLVFFTISWSIGMLPISFGGAVLVEGSMAAMFVKFALVKPEAALALALFQRVAWLLGSLPGALIHITGRHLPEGFRISQVKEEDIQ